MITFFIAFNTAVMAAKYDGINPILETIFENLNYLFAFIFNKSKGLQVTGLPSRTVRSAR